MSLDAGIVQVQSVARASHAVRLYALIAAVVHEDFHLLGRHFLSPTCRYPTSEV